MKRVPLLFLAIIFCAFLYACGNPTHDIGEYEWPDNDLSSLLPEPHSNIGEISYDSSTMFIIDVHQITTDQYELYIDDCKDCGFDVNYTYTALNKYYRAENADGYKLTLDYDVNKQVMCISLYAPADKSSASADSVASSTTSPAEHTNTEEPLPSAEATEPPTKATESTAELINGMRPEFKAALDSYEDFFREYCDFMKKYLANPTDFSLLADYGAFMEQYAETMNKLEDLDDGSLNNAELQYYLEVTNRITQMLLDVTG